MTEAAIGRTKNYYLYLLERQLLPKDGQPPAEVGPEESKINWYEQEDQLMVERMREQDVVGEVVREIVVVVVVVIAERDVGWVSG